MALQVTNLKRSFTIDKGKGGKNVDLSDPNPEMTPEEVMKFYSGNYPELTNAIVDGPKVVGDKANYTITTKAGKLG
jgi:PRTRC genetic system protein C